MLRLEEAEYSGPLGSWVRPWSGCQSAVSRRPKRKRHEVTVAVAPESRVEYLRKSHPLKKIHPGSSGNSLGQGHWEHLTNYQPNTGGDSHNHRQFPRWNLWQVGLGWPVLPQNKERRSWPCPRAPFKRVLQLSANREGSFLQFWGARIPAGDRSEIAGRSAACGDL